MTTIWEDPPESRRASASKVNTVADELAAHPGKWALVFSEAKLNNGHGSLDWLARIRGMKLQRRSQKNPDGTYKVWCRFIEEI